MPVRIALRITALAPTPSTSSSARPAPPSGARSAWRTRGRLAALSALLAVTGGVLLILRRATPRRSRSAFRATSWAGRPRRTTSGSTSPTRRDGHARRRRRPGRRARARRRRAGADRRRRERPVGDRRRDRARHSGRGAASGAAQRGRRRGRAGDLRAARRGRRRERCRARGRRAVGGEHRRSARSTRSSPAAPDEQARRRRRARSRWPPTSAASSRSTRAAGTLISVIDARRREFAGQVPCRRHAGGRRADRRRRLGGRRGGRRGSCASTSTRCASRTRVAIGRRPVALAAAGEDALRAGRGRPRAGASVSDGEVQWRRGLPARRRRRSPVDARHVWVARRPSCCGTSADAALSARGHAVPDHRAASAACSRSPSNRRRRPRATASSRRARPRSTSASPTRTARRSRSRPRAARSWRSPSCTPPATTSARPRPT